MTARPVTLEPAGTPGPRRQTNREGNRVATLIAWSLWGLSIFVITALLYPWQVNQYWYVLTQPHLVSLDTLGATVEEILGYATVPAYATIGALVASLRPRNGVGWLCLALASISALGDATWELRYNWYTLTSFLEELNNLAFILLFPPLPVTLMLLIFPTGSLLSRRWRLVVWMALGGPVLTITAGLLPDTYTGDGVLGRIGLVASLVALLASVVAVVFRRTRSEGQERQQIKWLVYAVALTVIAVLCAVASWYIRDVLGAMYALTTIASVVALAGLTVGIPVAIGFAILKHRLYDIDHLINRTLVYGALTLLLVLVYLGGIVVLQGPLRALTGQASQPAVVATTLAVAALFHPLRRRVQGIIDRRFYRKKYDAAETLRAFSARLRDETDLDALSGDLTDVARETLQPEHVSLWLRPTSNETARLKER